MKQTIRRRSGIFLLILFAVYYVNSVMFVHFHLVEDKIVVHSHSFSNSEHTHTTADCMCIAHLSFTDFFVDNTSVTVPVTSSFLSCIYIVDLVAFKKAIHLNNSTLRAPPFA